MAIVNLRDGYLSYQVRGSGPLVAMVLPQSRGPTGIGSLIESLSEYYTVLTYDQRGTGNSSASPESMSMETQAADLLGLLTALDVGQISLVCHSTGCGIGLSIVASHPTVVNAMVLAAPWTHGDEHLTGMQNLRVVVAGLLDPHQYLHFNHALLFPPAYRRENQEGFKQLVERASDKPQDAKEIARRLSAILAFDARPLLASIKVSTLVVSANDDQLMPPWFGKLISEGIDTAELIEYQSGGHMLPETCATKFAADVLGFLKRTVT